MSSIIKNDETVAYIVQCIVRHMAQKHLPKTKLVLVLKYLPVLISTINYNEIKEAVAQFRAENPKLRYLPSFYKTRLAVVNGTINQPEVDIAWAIPFVRNQQGRKSK